MQGEARMETLNGTIERVTFYNPENGYSVIKIKPEQPGQYREAEARDGTITVVGTMPELGSGENAQFAGFWVDDARYGKQFRAEQVTPLAPTTDEGIINFLSSGIVRGIGVKTATRIVEHFGAQTLNILDYHPERLDEVPAIKRELLEKLRVAWRENQAVRQIMIYLQGYGVSAKMAARIFNEYGSQTIPIVKENPYTLADDVFGIGFMRADEYARKMGVDAVSPQRIRAGLTYTLNQLTKEGHVFAPRDVLIARAGEILGVENIGLLRDTLDQSITHHDVILDLMQYHGERIDAVYLPLYFHAEEGVVEKLRQLSVIPSRLMLALKAREWGKFLQKLTGDQQVVLSEQQQDAVRAAIFNKVSILTGGPGTGKTTTLRMVIEALEALDVKYALASPTGRAAKRLGEATQRSASTIHRLLGYTPGEGFTHDEDDPLEVEMLIIDEASMIDLLLFYDVLKALKPTAHVMLVGDVDQLPSVGAGNVLRDVIDSSIGYVTRLATIFRQKDDSMIVLNAHRINQGEAPLMDNKSSDFYFFGEDDPALAAELVVDIVKNRLPGKFGIDPLDDVQVIAPMYRGLIGVDALNRALQAALNGDKRYAEKQIGGRLFRVGDKVMQTRNNYEKEVFNGDIGRIHAINFDDGSLDVVIDERYVVYDAQEIDELIHAYCISTHRSQGSEYPVVVMPLMTQHYMMLQRNLLYTAITRARRIVVLVGSRRAVHMAVQNNKVSERYTGLQVRLKNASA
jgi:exodeoxyribonuclease V alpha subunit